MIKYSSKSVCINASAGRSKAAMLAVRSRLYAAILLALSGVAQAAPQGGEVVGGDASISVNGDTMDIQQNSQRAIIHFESFDVASQETVNFHQPGSDAVALNRVVGSNLSEIHGAINANGQVYLINPNGVLFGNGAQVNVGGLVVTTLDIEDQDFLAGRDAFSGSPEGTIENRGTINADGRVVLLAPEVINRGDIHVPEGDITLRASQQALLHTPGSNIPILVDSSEFIGQVSNEGNLQAGDVALVLDGASQRDVYDAAINNTGLVRAVGVSGSGGSIELYAPSGDVANSGTLDASAVDGDGGAVAIDAERVFQSGAVRATAANVGQGGDIDLLASEGIVMHSGSVIDASADASGDGGRVVVFADSATWFAEDASIRARGGEQSGDGGFVEVSGQDFVSVAGSVDVGATDGANGLWFIDPTDITITSNSDSNGNFSGSNPATWTLVGAPATSLINVTTLRNTLNNDGDVLISSVSGGTGLGNITFDAALDYNGLVSTHTLTLQAHNQIIFTAGGRIFDSNTASAEGLNFVATAANGFSMAATSEINVGQGTIDIETAAGDAVITGLTSRLNISGTANAGTAVQSVSVAAPGGSILSANPATLDIDVKDSGLTLSAMGAIDDLYIESNFIDVASTTGDITLREEASTSVYRMQTPGTAFITTGGQFAVELATPFDVQNLQLTAGTDFRVADTGFSIPGNLTVVANNLRGDAATIGPGSAATPVILSAANADITLANGTLERHWSTSFDQLAVNISGGTGALNIVDTDGLTLSSVTTGGDASFASTGADLTFTAAPAVAGNLSLTTFGSGDLVVANAGLASAANLTVVADNLVGSGGTANVGATNADITLRDGAIAQTWTTSFDQLTLDITGAGDLTLTDTNGLTLNSITTGGNASFASTGADLILTATPVVAGDLSLSTVGSGNVIIPAAPFIHNGGALAIDADDLLDSDRTLSLEAMTADITLRNPGGAHTWTTEFGTLDLAVQSAVDIDITDDSGLSLGAVALAGNATISTTGADLVFTAAPVVAGDLNLTTIGTGDLVVANAGLAPTGNLTVVADNLVGSGGTATLGAANADITLRDGAIAQTWNTSFDQLALDIAGAGAFDLADTNGLTLNSIATGGNASFASTGADLILTAAPTVTGDLSLSTVGSGNVIIPAAPFIHNGGALAIDADDLLDTDRILALEAATADITLRNPGGAHTWTTEFGTLDLAVQSAVDIDITDDSGLSLGAVALAGNATISTTGADLVFTAAPVVAGDLNLTTIGTGDLVVANAGLAPTGNLTVVADNLVGSGGTATLGAANADITLRDGTAAQTWNTSFDQLALDIVGAGAFDLTDTNGLTLNSITTGGNASFASTGADLILTAAPTVTGDLNLSTVGSGNVIIPAAPFIHNGGALAIDADDLLDGDRTLSLEAMTADITLRNPGGAHAWTTEFGTLDLAVQSAVDIDITDDSGLSLGAVALAGNATISTIGADLVFTAAPVVAGDLNLTTIGSGDLVVANAGLAPTGNFTVVADNLVGSGGTATLGAANADITLRDGTAAQTWNTSFDQLALDIVGAGAFDLTDTNGLTLNSITTGGNASFATTGADLVLTAAPMVAGDLSLSTVGSGDLVIPDAGLIHTGALTVLADNLMDSDSTLTLGATNADITLRDGTAAQTWNTSFDQLALDIAGTGAFDLADSNGLTLSSATTGGNASFATTNANLVLTAAPTVAGDLSLSTVGSGDVVIPDAGLTHTGALAVLADNLVDSDSTLTLGATNADITLRDGTAAQTWNTSFDQLALDIAGAGAFGLTDSNGLTLSSATTGGNASFATTNADLVLAAAPTIAGDLSLSTVGSGDLIIPETGLNHGGLLTITADRLQDTDSSLILSATTLVATLRQQQVMTDWTTTLQNLDLSLNGGGALNLSNTGALTVDRLLSDSVVALDSTANLQVDNVTTTNDLALSGGGDLSLANATLGGDLQLTTAPTGVLITPDDGLTLTGDLTVDAGRLHNTSGVADTSWVANSASFRLRDTLDPTTINTQAGVLSIIQDTATALTVNVADGTQLSTLDSGGNVTVLSPGGLTLTGTEFAVLGELALDVSNDLQLAAGGLTVSNDLRISAANLSASGGGSPLLVGGNADLTLTDDQALTLTTRLSQLGVTYAAAGPFNLNNDRNLSLTRFAAPAAQEVGLTVNGTLRIPGTGLAAQQSLTIDAVDLFDTDRNLILAAPQLAVSLSNTQGNNAWAVTADELDVLIQGNASLAVTDADGLTLADLNNDGHAVQVENGNFGLTLTSGDLTVASNLSAADLNDDGIRAGIIDLAVAQGDLSVEGTAEIVSMNEVDQDAGTDSHGVRLRLTDTSNASRTITLGEAAQLRAVGGDILIDTRPAGTAANAERNFVQTLGSVVESYNSPDDTQNGVVLLNGEATAPLPGQVIRSGRTLALVTDVQEQPRAPGNVLNELDDLDKSIDVLAPESKSGPNAAAQFDRVFGSCNELDKQNPRRCRVDAALKAFLSHWLVGGEMPPKTELH